jgi:hypothetical protein
LIFLKTVFLEKIPKINYSTGLKGLDSKGMDGGHSKKTAIASIMGLKGTDIS